MTSDIDEHERDQQPTLEYAVMSDEDMIPRLLRSFPTLEAAYRSKRAADWVVAVENGMERPFTAEEEAALARMRGFE